MADRRQDQDLGHDAERHRVLAQEDRDHRYSGGAEERPVDRKPFPDRTAEAPKDERTERQRDYETGHSGDHDLDPEYVAWRRQQLEAYDRDYGQWRERQARMHDEDYRRWRGEAPRQSFGEWRGPSGAAFGASRRDPSGGQSTTGAAETMSVGDRGAGMESGPVAGRVSNIVHRTDDMQDRE